MHACIYIFLHNLLAIPSDTANLTLPKAQRQISAQSSLKITKRLLLHGSPPLCASALSIRCACKTLRDCCNACLHAHTHIHSVYLRRFHFNFYQDHTHIHLHIHIYFVFCKCTALKFYNDIISLFSRV